MRRTISTNAGRPEIQLHDIDAADVEAVERLVEAFRGSTKHGVDSTADMALSDFRANRLSADSIERLSRWANSDGTFTPAVAPARAVVHQLLGCPLERLVDENGRRVVDYAERLARLEKQITDDSG